jgi:hypothetical protein
MKYLKTEPRDAVLVTEHSHDFPGYNAETVKRVSTWAKMLSPILSEAALAAVMKNPALLKEIEGDDPELMYTLGVVSEASGVAKVGFKVWAPRRKA